MVIDFPSRLHVALLESSMSIATPFYMYTDGHTRHTQPICCTSPQCTLDPCLGANLAGSRLAGTQSCLPSCLLACRHTQPACGGGMSAAHHQQHVTGRRLKHAWSLYECTACSPMRGKHCATCRKVLSECSMTLATHTLTPVIM